MRGALALRAVGAVLAVAAVAWADGGEDEASSDDLLCVFRPFYTATGGDKWSKTSQDVPWTDWWYANRRNLLTPTTRARAEESGPGAEDAAARLRAGGALRASLASNDRLVASESALALGRAGDPADIPALAAIVDDRDVAATRRMHKYAALALGMLPLGDEEQARVARTALFGAVRSARGKGDEFSYFWTYCAYALAMRGDARVLPDLAALRAECVKAQRTAHAMYAEILGAVSYAFACLGGELFLPEIEQHLSETRTHDGGSNDTSWAATQALGRISTDGAREVLRKAAVDDRWMVRAGAFQALGALAAADDAATAKILREALADDGETACRLMAAVALGRQGHTTAADALLKALDAGRTDVRPFAAIGLGLLLRDAPDPAVSAKLGRALEKAANDDLSGALALACGIARLPDATPTLIQLVDRGSGAAGPLAAWALGEIGGRRADVRAVLHAAVARSGNALLRREAALALGTLRDPDIVGRLRAAVVSREPDVNRATAAVCLARVGSDADLDLLVGLLADRKTSDPLRPCIVHAIGWLLDRTDHAALGRITADVKWDKHVSGKSVSWTGEALGDLQHLVD